MTGAGETKAAERIRTIGLDGLSHPDAASLLHAYTACLSVQELSSAILDTLPTPSAWRSALRRRLIRLTRDGRLPQRDRETINELVQRCQLVARETPALRVSVDTILSGLFEHLPSFQQHVIIETWIDRGTSGAVGRWLKATSKVPSLFDEQAVMGHFRSTGDERAAKALANMATPAFLDGVLQELADCCERGWLVSKAAMRAASVPEEAWTTIRSKHPATYLYLCAQLHRSIAEDEALELVLLSPNSILNQTRGLAIWAVGQIGMIRVLDEIVARGEELERRDLQAFEALSVRF